MKKLVALAVFFSMAVGAKAGIMIYPKYVFFDDKTKSAEVTLINSSETESANYRISITYQKQNPDGSYTPVEAGELPEDNAAQVLRYSPRSVLLKPAQSQTIRILKRLPAKAKPGEYVGYVTFTEVLLEKAATKEDLKPGSMSVKITPIPSFSIPVFVRYKVKGEAPVTLTTEGLVDDNGIATLRVVMHRQEQEAVTSSRGDISIWDGDKMVGYVRGRYMLPDTQTLETRIPLRVKNGKVNDDGKKEDQYFTVEELKGKTLKVLFTESDENEVQKNKVFAQTTVTIE